MNIVESVASMIARYGFAVVPRELGDLVLDELRNRGAIHLVHVSKVSKNVIVIEVNRAPCIRECATLCRDTLSGHRKLDKEVECIDRCIEERIRTLLQKLRSSE